MPDRDLGYLSHWLAHPSVTSEAPENRARRYVLGAAAIGAIGYAGWASGWIRSFLPGSGFSFDPVPSRPGFRALPSGSVTRGGVPLFGLEGAKPQGLINAEAEINQDLCSALFGSEIREKAVVPVAYFFDYQCVICSRMTPMLRAQSGIDIAWHDLAGLGAASKVAARASVAAGMQGAYDAFHTRLMRSRFVATNDYVVALADSVGIDGDRLLTDMASEKVEKRMWLSRALADGFAMAGTPGLVVGRSVVYGDISAGRLRQLIEIEAAEPGRCR